MAKTPRSKGSSSGNGETSPFTDSPARSSAARESGATDDEWSLDEDPAEPGSASPLIPQSRNPQPIEEEEEDEEAASPQPSFESNPVPMPAKSRDLPVRPSAVLKPKAEPAADPFDTGDESLPEVNRPAPSAEEPEISEAERNDFADAGKTAAPEEKKTRPAWERLTLMGACAVTAITAGAILWSLLAHGPDAVAAPSNSAPSLPMNGATATVAAADAYWRARLPADRVSGIEVTLPAPERMESAILPEVKLTLDPGSSKTGFVRVSFMDSAHGIMGDVRVLKVVNGKFESMNQGETVISPAEASVYGSVGFTDRLNFLHYTSGDAPRWYVDVRESADYNANDAGWKKLDAFDIPNVLQD